MSYRQRHAAKRGINQLPGPLPQQRLVGPSHHLDRLGQVAVLGDGPQLMPVGPHHVGQRVGVSGVALGTRNAVPLALAGHQQRG
jgi:hypothetical protein